MYNRIKVILESVTKEYLYNKYVIENLTLRQIASSLKISFHFIQAKLKEFNITYLDKKKGFYLNQKFGLLQPTEYYTGNQLKNIGLKSNCCSYVKCKCDCGGEIIIKTHTLSKRKISPNCGCLSKIIRKNRHFDALWTGYEEISGSFLGAIKIRAKNAKLNYKLKNAYLWNLFIKQNRKCALSGIDIRFERNYQTTNKKMQTCSLDRIDSSKGYIEGNVQWVHKIVQQMKWCYNQEEFIKYCGLIYNFNKIIEK